MPAKVTIELDHAGIKELLNCDGVAAACEQAAERIAAAAGDGFHVTRPYHPGSRTVYRLEAPKTLEDVQPCPKCGWTGVEKCRKCNATGLVPCKARECKGGWIIRKNEIGSGKRNRHYKMSVEPCPTCHGVGQVTCPHCRGLEGTPCRKCHGLGKKVR